MYNNYKNIRQGADILNTHDTINDVLVKLFNEIWELEEDAIITGEFKNITVNDMHIIEAIGPDEGKNMSAIARLLGITVGSLTTSMNGLVKKDYVVRERSELDRRVVNIRLTDKGMRAYEQHDNFHKKMTDAVINSLDETEVPVLTKTLSALSQFFREFKTQ